MSADNYVLVRKLHNGYYWGNLSASYHWSLDRVPNRDLRHGPFISADAAATNAKESLSIIEYGIEYDKESNAHALDEERSDDSQQRVVGGKVQP